MVRINGTFARRKGSKVRGELELFDQPRPERNPAAVYIGRLGSAASRRVMRDALNLIATEALGVPVHVRVVQPPDSSSARLRRTPQEDVTYLYCAWGALRSPHTRAIRDWLAAATEPTEYGPSRYAPATVNRMLAALRGVLKEARRLGFLMRDEDYHLAAVDVRGISAPTLPRGRSLSHGELAALLACCRGDSEYYRQFPRRRPRDARDAALIAVLYSIGLRRFEIVALNLGDFDQETGAVRIRSGRPEKERECFLASGAMSAMADWLALRGASPRPTLLLPTEERRAHGKASLRPGDLSYPASPPAPGAPTPPSPRICAGPARPICRAPAS